MNELDFLKIIHSKLNVTKYLGNDCAELDLLENKRLVVTHDTLVQDVHFSVDFISPYELAYKSVVVNVSDLCAALAVPKYLSISLSLPSNISAKFVEEFYRGINAACSEFNCCVSGGDLTRSDKIVISICAIGEKLCNACVGRDMARVGDLVVLSGRVGYSSLGLMELLQDFQAKSIFTEAHISPKVGTKLIEKISEISPKRICAMDTSDGLADALYKISSASTVALDIDGNLLPVCSEFYEQCNKFNVLPEDILLFGAEDFSLLLTLPEHYILKSDNNLFKVIGRVKAGAVSTVKFGDVSFKLTEELIKAKTFKHFED